MKKKIVQIDFNPWHFICNMQCQYCIKHYEYKIEDDNLYLRNSKNNEYFFYAKIEHLFIRAYKVLYNISKFYDVGLLTFSGSEVFLFEEIFMLLSKVNKLFPKIQLITNGVNLDELYIEKFKEINTLNNMSITLSLDGNTLDSNYSRTIKKEDVFNRIINNFNLLAKSNVNFDIYTVVNTYNIEHLEEFFKYVEERKPGCGIQIWPVFGDVKIKIKENQIKYLEELLNRYDEFNLRLQPKVYYEKFLEYLKDEERKIICFLPRCSFYLQDTGDVKACLCNGIVDLGNILKENIKDVELAREDNVLAKKLFTSKNKILPCKECFINWDVLNLYFSGELKLEEVRSIPLFDDDNFAEILTYYKSMES